MAENRIDPGDLAGLRFRPRGQVAPSEAADTLRNLWWQIALGVFLGMLAHSMVVGLYGRYELQQFNKQLRAEMQRTASGIEQAAESPLRPTELRGYQLSPLRSGERCINGRRFVRVDNGWQQIMEPCH